MAPSKRPSCLLGRVAPFGRKMSCSLIFFKATYSRHLRKQCRMSLLVWSWECFFLFFRQRLARALFNGWIFARGTSLTECGRGPAFVIAIFIAPSPVVQCGMLGAMPTRWLSSLMAIYLCETTKESSPKSKPPCFVKQSSLRQKAVFPVAHFIARSSQLFTAPRASYLHSRSSQKEQQLLERSRRLVACWVYMFKDQA